MSPAIPCINRLATEKSPYLLQHSRQPVDWRPWGREAFDDAARLGRPVFLSIGYSACHWCHVMAGESFSDERIAARINKDFIPVKVDREEHSDLDNLFIKAVTAITGSAGWPLTVFLTPDKQPFFGGTYFPPEDSAGRPGLLTVLDSVSRAWNENRREILESAGKIRGLITANAGSAGRKTALGERVLRRGYDFLRNNFDPVHGGFGASPKFPTAFYIRFLFRYWRRFRETQGLEMAEATLRAMAGGGIRDHLSGGFHRYSTDEGWRLPHFEKMLYDQALLGRAYLEAFQVTGDVGFAHIGAQTLDFVLGQMAWEEGPFFSSLDSDSREPDSARESEGAFYLWTRPEIDRALGRDSDFFCFCYGVGGEGNIPGGATGGFRGKNVLYEAHCAGEAAAEFGMTGEAACKILAKAKRRLREARDSRPWPRIDDKVLCDWNGMMISSLCLAHSLFPRRGYARAAGRAAVFILENMRGSDGSLLHSYRDAEARIPGTLDDYAFFTEALLDLHAVTFDLRYLKEALRTVGRMVELFRDVSCGGFFITSPASTEKQFMQKELYDAAVPSGSSAALSALVRIWALTGDARWRKIADETVASVSGDIDDAPYSYINFLLPLFLYLGPVRQLVVAAPDEESAHRWGRAINSRFLPETVSFIRPWTREGLADARSHVPRADACRPLAGATAAYVCSDGSCPEAITSLNGLLGRLEARDA